MHALTIQLAPSFDVVMTEARSGTDWQGFDVPLPDQRDPLGWLRFPLATYGGVEMTVFGPDDLLSLTPELRLASYARSDRRYFLLDGLGLAERAQTPVPVWVPSRSKLAPSSERASALAAARRGLRAGTPTSAR